MPIYKIRKSNDIIFVKFRAELSRNFLLNYFTGESRTILSEIMLSGRLIKI